ncbi:hypothetical protein PFICI_10386 [Pestalotiopsis fici W106-1]|uniref:Uncharacterized protein n=1 Tax=Pestalotiopsis fici (strain W106-1 / CGMCC3.15140) TaxID=1229662 RepID=W3WX06_PESFW|nr:uncharacterized protein PFICI_10386 [Pestalotiopsis fici W106-1]ETS78324.1 hypothetical protein PFICI_10386 [Pestalotiopsis fici W106-1]
MAGDNGPRSVADATRFTANTPHASAKARAVSQQQKQQQKPSSSTKTSSAPGSRTTAGPQPPRRPAPMSSAATIGGPGGQRPESLDERVRRLRAAHLAARNHDVSRMDKVISSSRRYMDAAHRYTVLGLIGFSGIALLVTVYATVDMMVYNRKRRNEFFALQQQLQTDSLEAARLAYMTGSATEEQIALVEDATEKAKQAGMQLPSLLGTAKASESTDAASTSTAERTVWPGESLQESSLSGANEVEAPKSKGITGWLFGGLKKEDTAASQGNLSFNKEEATASGRAGAAAQAVAGQADALKDKAKAAFETEKEKQRTGGPLDQVGLDAGEKKKSGWFW